MFIPKHLYPAVMFAKKMIRDGTTAQKAIYRASAYYGVDMSDVASYVGRKHSAKSGYAYVIIIAAGYEDDPNTPSGMKEYRRVHYHAIEKTISIKSLKSKIARKAWKEQMDSDDFYGERSPEYAPSYLPFVSDKLYNTKKEAEKSMVSFLQQMAKN